MRTLVFITSHFPYGKGETFIESEFPFLEKAFDRIIIIAQDASGDMTRKVNDATTVLRYDTSTSFTGFASLPFLVIRNFYILKKLINEELSFRKTVQIKLNLKRSLHLIKRIIKVLQLRDFIISTLQHENIGRNIVFYSYWLKTGAQTITLLNYESSIKIARAHGSDIYEEKTKLNYLPLLRYTVTNLDATFYISDNGKKYMMGKTNGENQTSVLSYLGVSNSCNQLHYNAFPQKFVVVSCSNIIPLKRIDRIIAALEILDIKKEILWMHFGDGELKDSTISLANEKLSKRSNISFRFMGFYNNKDLLDFYCKNRIDLFVNTSVTEGLPVSMMEAQSAGIPIIATDVGGVSEIVKPGTGFLLPVNFTPQQLAESINYFTGLDEKKISEIRTNARNNWLLNFNAEKNYSSFVDSINQIFTNKSKALTDEN